MSTARRVLSVDPDSMHYTSWDTQSKESSMPIRIMALADFISRWNVDGSGRS
ncbi:hypothetical protein PISMIDRAFT_683755 [Pisolithus microcarpus 441]|uniref:Uncharacterized protein n=1 Tax=Pisolithus microcarpus 441 TaxID=765257 RepID=A0A0C9YQL0_9AGAM|nr:hypothetical protein PISMIDRAFT_683755 [Pisolithus microcarpus 441]